MSKIKSLVETFLKAKSVDEMENLLLGLLTPKEIEEFERRIEIVKLLKQGVAQHKIAEKLRVGVATVSRGAQELKLKRFKIIE